MPMFIEFAVANVLSSLKTPDIFRVDRPACFLLQDL